MLTKKESNKIFKRMTKRCIQYRGLIIHNMIELEWYIEEIIAAFFCTDDYKMFEMFHVISAAEDGKLTFNGKTNVLSYIINTHCPIFIKKYPQYIEELNQISRIRNIAAHRKLINAHDRIAAFDEDHIDIESGKIKNGKLKTHKEPFSKAIVKKHLKTMETLTERAREIADELNLKERLQT